VELWQLFPTNKLKLKKFFQTFKLPLLEPQKLEISSLHNIMIRILKEALEGMLLDMIPCLNFPLHG
jgi:hypothetical protein